MQDQTQSAKPSAVSQARKEDVSTVAENVAQQMLPKPCHQHVDTSFLSFALFTETLCWET